MASLWTPSRPFANRGACDDLDTIDPLPGGSIRMVWTSAARRAGRATPWQIVLEFQHARDQNGTWRQARLCVAPFVKIFTHVKARLAACYVYNDNRVEVCVLIWSPRRADK